MIRPICRLTCVAVICAACLSALTHSAVTATLPPNVATQAGTAQDNNAQDKTAPGDSAKPEKIVGHYICPPCGCQNDGKKLKEGGKCSDCGMDLVAVEKTWNVAIMVWRNAELLDFAGPGEVFSAARGPGGERFNVYTVSKTKDPILSQGFVLLRPTYSIADCPKPDIIVLPGGGGRAIIDDAEMLAWIKSTAEESEIALSVCTGAFILGKTGLLDGLDITTWHGAMDDLRTEFPNSRVHDDRRFIDNGHIITSAGVSAGIDSALHVVTRLMGLESARNTARYMEYDWHPERFGDAEAAADNKQPEKN